MCPDVLENEQILRTVFSMFEYTKSSSNSYVT